jgi:branched-subunit amino acid aminotransferase/4-amino-4-deoxychorismate lyase
MSKKIDIVITKEEKTTDHIPFMTEECVFTSFQLVNYKKNDYLPLGWPLHFQRIVLDCKHYSFAPPSEEVLLSSLKQIKDTLIDCSRSIRVEVSLNKVVVRAREASEIVLHPPLSLQTCVARRPQEHVKSFLGARFARKLQEHKQIAPEKELLFLTRCSSIIEGAWSNFGWITRQGYLGIVPHGLSGVTRRVLSDLLPPGSVKIRCIDVETLIDQEFQPFIMSALRGIVPVQSIDAYSFEEFDKIYDLRRKYLEAQYTSSLRLL